MASEAFTDTLDSLAPDDRAAVEGAFAALGGAGVSWSQVCENVRNETALGRDDFASLLRDFARKRDTEESVGEAWVEACRAHQLRGRALPPGLCPRVLGRAVSRKQLMLRLEKEIPDVLGEARDPVLGLGGPEIEQSAHISFHRLLSLVPFGRHVVWATFNTSDPGGDPFEGLRHGAEAVRIGLGMGLLEPGESVVLLTWSHAESGAPSLHRPTVGDAGLFEHFRPVADPNAPWGETRPLEPNPLGLAPRPEVVSQECGPGGLRAVEVL
jgi:hypothetical protein